ncbi:MAG TPA: FAD-dependent oxidoreductase [Gaiellaceae bacterium]|nr:FAD-dependent oxidoreductase [Gaiellaceae bacterium]
MSTSSSNGSSPAGYDALVVGSGIGGMESALKLGAMGYRVLVVEKEPSVGGKMILLSKVFPTLDCASCISTPKMAATTHHPNLTVLTDAEVEGIVRDADGRFTARIKQKPRFVDVDACTGCRLCEVACTVSVPDQFNGDFVARRAAYIPFPQAVPQKALVERAGTSPCSFACPAGIKAHGYVSLMRSGEPEKAFQLVLETTPFVGSLGRACYAPCEEQCTRGELEGALPIRRIKRFVADAHYASAGGPGIDSPEESGKRVAVVGSGPAGITAAWQLRLQSHAVKVFEAAPVAGGALRLAIPSYRLPAEVVERDLANATAIGVEIETDARIDDPADLREQGFDAVLLATGTPVSARLGVAGEELSGIHPALDLLRSVKLAEAPDFTGKTVAVIGGGNVAIDAARSVRRLGAAAVHQISLESRQELPAHEFEVEEALAEGIVLHDAWGICGFRGDGAVSAVELKRCTAVFDADGRFAPQYDETETDELACDAVVVAIGMRRERNVDADPVTLQTAEPWLFAAGDVVNGPTLITTAVGSGRRAAFMIDRFLRGEELDEPFDVRLPVVEHADVLARQKSHSYRAPLASALSLAAAPTDFAELEPALTAAEARAAAGRCLDCGVCSECHECVNVCPADAIRLEQRPQEIEVDVGSVIVSTGYTLFPADAKPEYGYGRFENVITGVQMERLLAPTRPYNTVLRPSDGKVPERIAYVMCTGSRDETVGNPLCSKFCCMYSIKQNQLIMGALPLADVTVHYIDIRASGKGYDEFFEQAKAMGGQFVKGRVASIAEAEEGNLILRYEDVDAGVIREAEYDLVVLAVGVRPNLETKALFSEEELALDEFEYVDEPDDDANPGATSIPGVFVAGAASGAKDIPESILHAGAAVAQAAAHLERARTAVPA